MKLAKVTQLMISGLVVFAFATACKGQPVKQASQLVDDVAIQVSRAAEEARIAKAAAEAAKAIRNNADELARLRSQANQAARNAEQAAAEAKALQQSIDDLQLQRQLALKVEQAAQSAREATSAQQSIDDLVRSVRLMMAQSSLDDISTSFVQRTVNIPESPQQQQIKEAVKNIVTSSICDVLVETLRDNEFPSEQEVVDTLAKNTLRVVGDDFELAFLAQDIISEVDSILQGTPREQVQVLEDGCEALLPQ